MEQLQALPVAVSHCRNKAPGSRSRVHVRVTKGQAVTVTAGPHVYKAALGKIEGTVEGD